MVRAATHNLVPFSYIYTRTQNSRGLKGGGNSAWNKKGFSSLWPLDCPNNIQFEFNHLKLQFNKIKPQNGILKRRGRQPSKNTGNFRSRYSLIYDLSWLEDKIKAVPSNYRVALKVLGRTMHSLESKKLDDTYLDLFRQQEAEGIIDRIEVLPQNFNKYVWIPNRPIFKTDYKNKASF